MDPIFGHLREQSWHPTFDWKPTPLAAADRINVWHEDYPQRVQATSRVIASFEARKLNGGPAAIPISNDLLLQLHRTVFRDEEWAGQWRKVQVRVGEHRPPRPGLVPAYMQELEDTYKGVHTVEDLVSWYTDFETIHPFLDGNGRVGGIVVATFSHLFHPEMGWLAPDQ